MAPILRIRRGSSVGASFALQTEMVLGRTDADVVLDDPEVSRRHAIIMYGDDGLSIEDLASRNGTWLNGARIKGRTPLRIGDVIVVGRTNLEVTQDDGPSQATIIRPRD